MAVSNIITGIRIALSPVFVIVFFLIDLSSDLKIVLLIILWIIFVLMEISDLFDGIVARKLKIESDMGKLLDPFADSFSRLTYFFCFTMKAVMPFWIFLIVMYRDLTVSFIRILAAKNGVTMGSRMSGKIKAWIYAAAGILGIITYSFLLIFKKEFDILKVAVQIIFILAAVVAIWSLIDYITAYRKSSKKN